MLLIYFLDNCLHTSDWHTVSYKEPITGYYELQRENFLTVTPVWQNSVKVSQAWNFLDSLDITRIIFSSRPRLEDTGKIARLGYLFHWSYINFIDKPSWSKFNTDNQFKMYEYIASFTLAMVQRCTCFSCFFKAWKIRISLGQSQRNIKPKNNATKLPSLHPISNTYVKINLSFLYMTYICSLQW